jgi:hypothetical protein
MGESLGVIDPSITSFELRPEGYHLKLVRAATKLDEDVDDFQDDPTLDNYDVEDY